MGHLLSISANLSGVVWAACAFAQGGIFITSVEVMEKKELNGRGKNTISGYVEGIKNFRSGKQNL